MEEENLPASGAARPHERAGSGLDTDIAIHAGDMLLWGLLATGLLTTLLRAGQALHLTRMDPTLLLGTDGHAGS